MKRIIGTIAAVILGATLLILLTTGVVALFLWATALLGVQHTLGMDTQSSKNYATVSGIGPVIVSALGFSSLGVAAWHHLNCHIDGCKRIGTHRLAGGKYLVCGRCLKDAGSEPESLTIEHVHEAHIAHEA
jgi:hypothetical protein